MRAALLYFSGQRPDIVGNDHSLIPVQTIGLKDRLHIRKYTLQLSLRIFTRIQHRVQLADQPASARLRKRLLRAGGGEILRQFRCGR